MLPCTLVLSQLQYVNSILSRAQTTTVKTISNNTTLCSQDSQQEVKKREGLHMSTRIALATHQV